MAPLYLTVLGVVLLMVVSLNPVWDSAVLANSKTYVYFLGASLPITIIVFCCSVCGFFVLAMLLLAGCGRQKANLEPCMYLFTSTITVLGLGLLFFSQNLQLTGHATYHDLMASCNISARTVPLVNTYDVLLRLRLRPDCLQKESVENCKDFQPNQPYTDFLKQLELEDKCSGFCYVKNQFTIGNTSQPPLTAVLAQQAVFKVLESKMGRKPGRAVRNAKRQETQGVFLLSANQTLSRSIVGDGDDTPLWEKIPKGDGNTEQNMMATGWMDAYPPTLFTNANYKTTCQGAAAREIRFTAMESGYLMYLTGVALLVSAIIIGFVKTASLCRIQEQEMEIVGLDPDGTGQFTSYAKKVLL